MCPTKGVRTYTSWEHESNSGLAQDLSVTVDKIHMVAERLLDLRSPIFSLPSQRRAQAMEFTPSYVHNVAEKNLETIAMMAGAAMTAKVTFNVGGKIICYIYDKARELWVEEKPKPRDYAVETFQLSGTASLLESPATTEQQSAEKDPDAELQKPEFVAKGIKRLNKQNEQKDDTIQDLKQRNEMQQRMIKGIGCNSTADTTTTTTTTITTTTTTTATTTSTTNNGPSGQQHANCTGGRQVVHGQGSLGSWCCNTEICRTRTR